MWYSPDYIANILSLSTVSNIYRVTIDSSVSHAMHVYLPGGVLMTFHEIPHGLYCHVTRSYSDQLGDQLHKFSFVNTV